MEQESAGSECLGFTLIELLIGIAILGLIAALAYPDYSDYLRKSRRSDAFDALLHLQTLQEKYRANNLTYGTLEQTSFPGTISFDGFYKVAVSSPSATGYLSSATAIAGTTQAEDGGCTLLILTVNSSNPRGLRLPAACW